MSVFNRLIEEYNAWYQLEQKEFEMGCYQFEIEQLRQKISDLESENFNLKTCLQPIQQQSSSLILAVQQIESKRNVFGAAVIKNNDHKTNFYTDLQSYNLFLRLFELLHPLIPPSNKTTQLDEFFIVHLKLRLGVPNEDLATRLDVTPPYISTMFHNWLNIMAIELKSLIAWPEEEALQRSIPACFKKLYSSTTCIIDCFEIFIERLSFFQSRVACYSYYKKYNTVKVLIAVTPTGSICFISKAWGGRVSDKVITQESGFLRHIN